MELPQRELQQMLQHKNLLHLFDSGTAQRPGSAPPQMDDAGGSPMMRDLPARTIFAPSQHATQLSYAGDAAQASSQLFGEAMPRDMSDPDYVRYYYANKNFNPRLPPPSSRNQPWNDKGLDAFTEQVHDPADTQAALNIFFGSQLGLKEPAASHPIPARSRSFLAQQQQKQHGTWHARSGSASEHLNALLQAYSPKELSPLVSGDFGTNAATAPGSSPVFGARALADEASSLQEALFNAGSNPHTPRSSHHASFDAAVGSPPRSGSLLSSQDLKLGLVAPGGVRSLDGQPLIGGRGQRRHEPGPSKLRLSSNNTDFNDSPIEMRHGRGLVLDAADDLADAPTAAMNIKALPRGMLHSMNTGEQQAAAAMAGMAGPDSMAALLGNQPGMQGMPNQIQSIYMAAMYPFYAQQAMQASSYPGFMGMPQPMMGASPMMGYPGFQMMGPGGFPGQMSGIPDMRPAFPMMPPGPFPPAMQGGMPPPFPQMIPGMPPQMMPGMPQMQGGQQMMPEYGNYYSKMMEAQAAMAAAVGGPDGGSSNGSSGDLDAFKRPGPGPAQPFGMDGVGMSMGMPGRHAYEGRAGHDMSPERNTREGRGALLRGPGSGNDRRVTAVRRDVEDKHVDPVLEDFKNNKTKRFEFQDILGHVYEFSLDQHGSRFIQQKLETLDVEELDAAFQQEVLPRALTLMTDVFGNYVVQKLLDHGSPGHRLQLAQVIQGNVLSLSLQMYGCRVIQKALEVLPTENQCDIVAELDGQIMRCVRDQNGNHVIQKVIECVPTHLILHLLDSFLACVVQLSSHPFGCRVIQRILEHCQDVDRRSVVMEDILRSACQLAQDQYGNYVIQHVLEHGTPLERMQIVTQVAPQVVSMSMHKFASNVVEKCLIFCSVPERDLLIQGMMGSPVASEQEDPLQLMMKDQFGNYVVQKVLEVCDDMQREMLLGRVRMQLHALEKYTYGKHIVARVEKLLAAGTKLQSSARLGAGKARAGQGGVPLEDYESTAVQLQQNDASGRVAGAGADGDEKDTGDDDQNSGSIPLCTVNVKAAGFPAGLQGKRVGTSDSGTHVMGAPPAAAALVAMNAVPV